ncbi:J domain-containing protein [Halomonas nitroreducens]|uniref:Molecular chaperone DnaJ n=1 Tax=Halomonas nitroreducens TaxID=447425 RepID=A0A431V275_9GAMM|nr:J domain-containing protein [Halomonas nitroreducens]RTR02867.1 molecular chaperone DnaJ [Halomonas nitroreducens]
MTAARFSPFELLLLQSRDQADTAALLLLAWVLTQQGPVGESERAHLTALTGAFRHGHELAPVLEVAASQDLGAIQLAAEVLQKELHGETSRAFLRLAVTLATEEAEPTLANHHVLRFLADLLGVAPAEFAALYASQAGRPLREPGDPSRHAYWQRREKGARERRRKPPPGKGDEPQDETQEAIRKRQRDERAEARRQARAARAQARHEQHKAKEQARARQRAEREAERRHKQARREAERERQRAEREAARQRRQAHRERRRESHDERRQRSRPGGDGTHHAHARATAPDPRIRSALTVLGLEPGASRGEIRKAYRRLAQAHHPDRFHREGEAIVASASRRFQRIRKAYDFLMKVS